MTPEVWVWLLHPFFDAYNDDDDEPWADIVLFDIFTNGWSSFKSVNWSCAEGLIILFLNFGAWPVLDGGSSSLSILFEIEGISMVT